uniref:Uncharacterized protein n=1 Tax=Oryza nivara TaxID=4536 RepID=A0A0E0ID80_ORYNI
MHVTPQNFTAYSLSPTQSQDFGITHSSLPKSNVNSFQQNGSYVQPTMHKAKHRLQNDDIKLASSAMDQFHEEFSFKRKNLEEEIYRDMMKRLNVCVLNKRSEPTFVLEQKPNNVELSTKKKNEPFVLPYEFRAKEVDEHQIDGARVLENTEKTLEGHHMAKHDIVQNPPKSSRGYGSQPRYSHSLSNWQKQRLHKLSVEKLS